MPTSILVSTKKSLGLVEAYKEFDPDIIMHINSIFMVLTQIGIGPTAGYSIEDDTETWEDYLSGQENLKAVQSYMYLRVRMLFDPPATSFVLTSLENIQKELEWRLLIGADEIKFAPAPEQPQLPTT